MTYRFRGYEIPDYMMPGLTRYVEQGIEPGSFLYAVLCNDLKDACGRADENNLANLPAYAAWIYNEAPAQCHGSPERVQAWIESFEQARETVERS